MSGTTNDLTRSATPGQDDVVVYIKPKLRPFVAIALFVCIFTTTMFFNGLQIAAASVVEDLNGWDMYALMFTAQTLLQLIFSPLTPAISKKITIRGVVLLGCAFLILQSVVCALAPTMLVFVVGRAIGGIGGAFTLTGGLTLIGLMLPTKTRVKYMGFYGTMTGFGAIISPIAGWICETFTWQVFMWIVLIVSVIGTVVVLLLVPNTGKNLGDNEEKSSKMDWRGVVMLTGFITLTFAFLSFGGLYFERTSLLGIVILILAALFLVGFIMVERKAPNPTFPLDLFKHNAFRVAAIGVFLQTATTSIISTYMPTYAQKIMGTSAATSGMVVVAVSIIFMFVGPIAGQLLGRFPKFKLCCIAMPISFVIIQLILMSFTAATPIWLLYVCYGLFYGITGGLNVMIWLSIVQTFLPNDKIAHGTSGIQTVLVFGALIGTAVAGNVMNLFSAGGENLKGGLDGVFIFGIICAVLALINAFTLKVDASKVEVRIAAKKPLFARKTTEN